MKGFRSAGIAAITACLVVTPCAAGAQTNQKQTIQQQFDAAVALDEKGRPDEALVAWEALEKRAAKNPRNQALMRVRKAGALVKLRRLDDAAAAARAGLAALPVGDASLAEDRYLGWMTVAYAARDGLDYAGVVTALNEARKAMAETSRGALLLQLLRAQTFTDLDAAQRTAGELRTLMATEKVDDQSRGIINTAISEMYLNLNRFAEARDAAQEAVRQLGGMTLLVSLTDTAARSDAAIALLRLGDGDEARRYLAYTGAGRSTKDNFLRPKFDPLICGTDSGVKPDDVAVIEVTVADSGAVSESLPVYSSAGGAVALAFARSARDWVFDPEQVKTVPAFFRTRARLELRCSTAFPRPSIIDLLGTRRRDWMEDNRVAPVERRATLPSVAAAADRARLAALDAKGGGNSLPAADVLFDLASNTAVGQEESHRLATRAKAIVDAAGAPPLVRLAYDMRVALTSSVDGAWARNYPRWLNAAMTSPPYAGDAEARSVLALLLADIVRARDPSRSRTLVAGIAADAGLPDDHPFKVGALVRLASIEKQAGNGAAAQAAFQRTGLDARQCALLDAPPQMRWIGSNAQFPEEARRWGFEGWTVIQSDIASDGRAQNMRAVMAYPPFVFGQAGQAMVGKARFTASYRPDGGIGCGGQITPILYRLPN